MQPNFFSGEIFVLGKNIKSINQLFYKKKEFFFWLKLFVSLFFFEPLLAEERVLMYKQVLE